MEGVSIYKITAWKAIEVS